jgi:hypothetical protein
MQGDGWRGVYVHGDGYPTWQGPQLWTLLHTRYQGNVAAFTTGVIDAHPCGYSVLPDECYCHDPIAPEEEGMPIASTDEADCAATIEWVYIVGHQHLTIVKSVPAVFPRHDEHDTDMDIGYTWTYVTQVPLTEHTPDWRAIEMQGEQLLASAQAILEKGIEP